MNDTCISVRENITLITIQDVCADICFLASIFESIASMQIDIDMISLAPAQSYISDLSFTIDDDDLVKILSYISSLHKSSKFVKPIISSGNYKISICDNSMRNSPGFASKIFNAVASVNADIRIITTSETELSILLTQADFEPALSAIKNIF